MLYNEEKLMPAVSQAQQTAAAIALHGKPSPGSAAAKMKDSMSKAELKKFAKTKKADLPKHVKEGKQTFKDFLVESRTNKDAPVVAKPRAKQLHDNLASKKGGGHYTEKSDYKRAKETQKFRRERSMHEWMGWEQGGEAEEVGDEQFGQDAQVGVAAELDSPTDKSWQDIEQFGDKDHMDDDERTDEPPQFDSYDEWKTAAKAGGCIVKFDRDNNACHATTRNGDLCGEFDHNDDTGWLENPEAQGDEAAHRNVDARFPLAEPGMGGEFGDDMGGDVDSMADDASQPPSVGGLRYTKFESADPEIKQISFKQLVESVELQEKYLGFKKLEGSLAGQKGVTDPAGLAAAIGRKKYGKKKFQKAAAKGKKLGRKGKK